ncbi:MAG: hypothetical protein JWL64_731 [Frankiales bacterium]|nr:hypothetical protein [Frankiales bacterium]
MPFLEQPRAVLFEHTFEAFVRGVAVQLVEDLPLDGATLLELAVLTLQAEDAGAFRPGDALVRAGRVLSLQERLRPVELAVVGDVDRREL